MDERRWLRAQEIFSQAVEAPVEERHALVEGMCIGDAELAGEILGMLEEDQRGQPLLDAGVEQAARAMLEFGNLPSLIEKQIGPYRVLRLLGEGGMGVVYLAERTDIGGKVAIKLLRDAWLSPMRRHRFRVEQTTLAQLSHASIARIYDANTLEDGTPWFVMEYAEGLPLTEHWRQRGGSVRECLKLFRRVCEAVQYAHSHAIIHRDLKPSNILVNELGEVKLLDFGIAKQLNVEEGEDRTVTGLRLMTLAYAAPEQLSGGAVGVYTDVYALGVLLYELVSGKLPQDAQGRLTSRAGTMDKVSTVVRKSKPELRRQLSRSEWGELDLLVSKAMEAEGGRRYGTVDGLMRDVDALLEGRPLEARPAEWTYTARKFLNRNRRALTALASVLLVLAGTVLFYTMRVAQARNAALREADRAKRIQEFTESLFHGGDKEAGPASELKVVEVLDRGRREVQGLGGDAGLQADLETTLGRIYQKLGKLQLADSLLSAAWEKRREAFGPADARAAESEVTLGLLRKEQGRLDEAEKLVREGLATIEQDRKAPTPVWAYAMVGLGSVLNTRGKYDEATEILSRGLKLQVGQATSRKAENLEELGNAAFYKGDYTSAEDYNKQAYALYRGLFGEEHPSVGQILNNLGAIESNRGNYGGAEGYYRHALAITQTWYGTDHPETAANLTSLAQQLSYEKRDGEAIALLERALAIQKQGNDGMSAMVASTQNELGMVAYNAKHYDAARTYFTNAMETWRKALGDEHQFVAVAYSNLGSVCLDEKDYTCAENSYRDALKRLNRSAKDTLNAAVAHVKLGRALLREGRFQEAEVETQQGYDYLAGHVRSDNGFLRASRKDLAAINEGLHHADKAAYFRAELERTSDKR